MKSSASSKTAFAFAAARGLTSTFSAAIFLTGGFLMGLKSSSESERAIFFLLLPTDFLVLRVAPFLPFAAFFPAFVSSSRSF